MDAKPTSNSSEAGSAAAERGSFETRVRELLPLLRRVALYVTKDPDEADDLVQEALTRMWTRRATYAGQGSYDGWAVTIVWNLAMDVARESTSFKTVAFEECRDLADPEQDLEEQLWRNRRAAVLRVALGRLDPDERFALVSRCVDGRSAADTAAELGVATKAVAGLVRRARQKLRCMDDVLELVADDD